MAAYQEAEKTRQARHDARLADQLVAALRR
ncbi:hypothetical protein SAMN05446589_0195 [Streptomyces sp. OV198]|jgi:hypothetical protein|nr:hypothetical protein SAMN05446589_0195 [Streptomyces sp. OV198]